MATRFEMENLIEDQLTLGNGVSGNSILVDPIQSSSAINKITNGGTQQLNPRKS